MIKIYYEDEHFLIVYKPSKLLVHASKQAEAFAENLQDKISRQLNSSLQVVHRLDRATSGLIILGKSSTATRNLSETFARHQIQKYYLAICRGLTKASELIEKPLKDLDTGILKDSQSSYLRITDKSFDNQLQESRYSLLLVEPKTGRRHQIRRHLKSSSHPIIGDTRYGKSEHNYFFRDTLNIDRLLLQSVAVSFIHPFSKAKIKVQADIDTEFTTIFPCIEAKIKESIDSRW